MGKASNAYSSKLEEVRELISSLDEAVLRNAKELESSARPINWANVGDLSRLASDLRVVLEYVNR